MWQQIWFRAKDDLKDIQHIQRSAFNQSQSSQYSPGASQKVSVAAVFTPPRWSSSGARRNQLIFF